MPPLAWTPIPYTPLPLMPSPALECPHVSVCLGGGLVDKWCVGVCVCGCEPTHAREAQALSLWRLPGPEMLSAAPHPCSTEANINRATEPPPSRAALECPRLLPTLLGSYPWSQEPGIRLQLAGLPAAPAGLPWACSAAWAGGLRAQPISVPPATLPTGPRVLAWQRSRVRGWGCPDSLHSPRPPSLPQDPFHEATGNRSVRARNRTF